MRRATLGACLAWLVATQSLSAQPKAGAQSRSFDGSDAKISWRERYKGWALKWHLKALLRYNMDETNIDFSEYVGPFEFGSACGYEHPCSLRLCATSCRAQSTNILLSALRPI